MFVAAADFWRGRLLLPGGLRRGFGADTLDRDSGPAAAVVDGLGLLTRALVMLSRTRVP
ncbi:hypothetical protein [Streptomyces sp. NBC_00343]|uniref:hypothetical protein n=1 Tax=Streptomyces sp. NBC_00343 TaxID=2975719 RepID=UPI002E2A8EE6|nr:hypothetical protein [Streptomyces sp. NBC_00343]